MPRKLTIKEIESKITKLQQQAAEIKDEEKAGIVARMKEAIAYYGITASDLGLGAGGRKKGADRVAKAKVAKKAPPKASRVKYRDDAGHTWSGYGPKPRWFVDALANGKTEADLRA